MNNPNQHPFKANDNYVVNGNWAQVLFYRHYDIPACYCPGEWNINSPLRKPVAILIEQNWYIGYSLTDMKNIFVASLRYKYSAN